MQNSASFLQDTINLPFSLRYIYREPIFDEKNKIIFIHLPKCASTSLQYLMLKHMGKLHDDANFTQIKGLVLSNSLKEKTRNIADAFLAFRSSFVFSVMRDPIKRFVSAHNMIIARKGYREEIEGRLGKSLNGSDYVDDLIDYLYFTRLPDWHFRPQSAFLRAVQNITILPMDAVKIEKALSDAGHDGDWISGLRKTVLNPSTSNKIEFTSKQLGKLTDYYRSDFDLADMHGIELY
jgi:hypothetical protein